MTETTANADAVLAELTRLGEIASGIIDGEDVKGVVTEEAMAQIIRPDPKFPYMSGDSFDVDHELFLRVKKLLLRIARLGKVVASGSMWIPVPGTDEATVILHNGVHHRWYDFGQVKLPTPPALKEVFATGELRKVPCEPGDKVATVVSPIRDSLGDVVGAVEYTASLEGPAPVWS